MQQGRTVLDKDKNVKAAYDYSPYGVLIGSAGDPTFTQPYQYSTKRKDAETGIIYFGYRFYLPNEGRWLNRDPIEEMGGLNLYQYVGGDPVNYIDPFGLSEEVMGGAAALACLANPPACAAAAAVSLVAGGIAWCALNAVSDGADDSPYFNEGSEEEQSSPSPGSYRPDRALPRDKNGNPIPDTDAPHTQLGKKKSKRGGDYTQGREWGYNESGELVPNRDIDFTDHGRKDHANPHQHDITPNSTGGTPQRGPQRPLQWPER